MEELIEYFREEVSMKDMSDFENLIWFTDL